MPDGSTNHKTGEKDERTNKEHDVDLHAAAKTRRGSRKRLPRPQRGRTSATVGRGTMMAEPAISANVGQGRTPSGAETSEDHDARIRKLGAGRAEAHEQCPGNQHGGRPDCHAPVRFQQCLDAQTQR